VVEGRDICARELKCIIEFTSVIPGVVIMQQASIVVHRSHRVVMLILSLGKPCLRVGIVSMAHCQVVTRFLVLVCISLSLIRDL
jgi:hypothetical protein